MSRGWVMAAVVVAALTVTAVALAVARDGPRTAAEDVELSASRSGEHSNAPQGVPTPAPAKEAPDAAVIQSGGVGGGFGGAPTGGAGEGTGGDGGAPLPLPQLADRQIIRTATLELTAEDVAGAAQEVETVAISVGGFVSGSSLTVEELPRPAGADEDEPPPKRQTATVTIRVPADSYASVMSRLRGIADEIRSENSETSEVTEEYTDLQARQRNLQATEARYLELLAKAESVQDILTVQDRINTVRLEIEQVQGRLNLLDSITDMATITVRLAPPAPPAQQPPGEPGWAEEAWEDAKEASQDVLEALGTAGIVLGVILAWLAVPALALVVGWRLLGPRRGAPGGGAD